MKRTRSALRWAAMVAGLALGIGVFALSSAGRQFWAFVLDSRIELRKMVWPTVAETRQTTLLVFAFVVVMALFFWLVDMTLGFATRWLLPRLSRFHAAHPGIQVHLSSRTRPFLFDEARLDAAEELVGAPRRRTLLAAGLKSLADLAERLT